MSDPNPTTHRANIMQDLSRHSDFYYKLTPHDVHTLHHSHPDLLLWHPSFTNAQNKEEKVCTICIFCRSTSFSMSIGISLWIFRTSSSFQRRAHTWATGNCSKHLHRTYTIMRRFSWRSHSLWSRKYRDCPAKNTITWSTYAGYTQSPMNRLLFSLSIILVSP